MRLRPALAFATILLPVIAVAQTDEWVRDDMTDDSLVLLQTGNLSREPSTAGVFPGAPERGSQWVVSKGDGPAYVVYFLPGPIHEVEIDTHRLAGAAGDFTLAVSTDGKLYEPIDTGSVLLDSSFGWDYRLMASDQIPENATHLLVQFPNGSTAHRLSEVWIRYTWDDALVNNFLPAPAATPPAQGEFSLQSDADLQLLLDQLMAVPRKDPAPSVDPLDTSGHAETAAFPEPQTGFAAPPSFENVPALGQAESLPVDNEEEEEEIAEPALVVGDATLPETVDEKNSMEENAAPGVLAIADESTPTIVAQDLLGENEASEAKPDSVIEVAIDDPPVASAEEAEEAKVPTDASVVAAMTDEPQEPIDVAIGLLDAPAAEILPRDSGTTEIDTAEFSPVVASIDPGEPIEIEPLAITADESETPAISEAVSTASAETLLPEDPPVASEVAEIDVAEFSPEVDNTTALETVFASVDPDEPIEIEPLAIAAAEPEHAVTNETQAPTELTRIVEESEPVVTELVATPEPGPPPSSRSISEEPAPTAPDVTEIAVTEFETPAEAASDLNVPPIAAPAEEAVITFDHSGLAPADADEPATRDVEVAMPEPTLPEFSPAPTVVAETEPVVVADPPVIAQIDEPASIADSQPDVAVSELPAETLSRDEVVDPALFADPEVEVAATFPEIIAIPTTTEVASEEPEQVWRLPPFDLPIMSASQAREGAASLHEEPVSSRVESPSTAVQEPATFDAVESSTQIIAAAPDAVDLAETPAFDASAAGVEAVHAESAPAASSDSGPMLIAAAEEPAVHAPESEIAEDTEPDRRPAVKVRRVGPRSKSRDFYSARR